MYLKVYTAAMWVAYREGGLLVGIYGFRGWQLSVAADHVYAWYDRMILPVTYRAKGYIRFVGKYVTDRRKRFRPHKVYILNQDH